MAGSMGKMRTPVQLQRAVEKRGEEGGIEKQWILLTRRRAEALSSQAAESFGARQLYPTANVTLRMHYDRLLASITPADRCVINGNVILDIEGIENVRGQNTEIMLYCIDRGERVE